MDSQFMRGIKIVWERIAKESYLWGIPSIKSLNSLNLNQPITFFVGENGSGKSTLLEGIAVASGFNAEGGTKNYMFATHDSHSELHRAIEVERGIKKPKRGYFLRAESFYNVATKEEEYAEDGEHIPEELHKKSHGESFLTIIGRHFGAQGLYILDEPEAALSPQRQLTLLMEIQRCIQEGSQFIIATHSPILLAYPEATIYSFDNDNIEVCSYEETEAYQVTEMFINYREQILYRLLEK